MYHVLISSKRTQIVNHKKCVHNHTRLHLKSRSFSSIHNEGELPWQSHQKIQKELEAIEIQKQTEHYQKNFEEPERKAYYDARYSTLLGRYRAEAIQEANYWKFKMISSQDTLEALRDLEKIRKSQQKSPDDSTKTETTIQNNGSFWTRLRQFVLEKKIPLMIDIPKESLEPEKWKKPPLDWNLVVDTLNEQLGLYNKKLAQDDTAISAAELEQMKDDLEAAEILRREMRSGNITEEQEEYENEVAEAMAKKEGQTKPSTEQEQEPQPQQPAQQRNLDPAEMLKRRAKQIKKEQEARAKAAAKKKKKDETETEQQQVSEQEQQEQEEAENEFRSWWYNHPSYQRLVQKEEEEGPEDTLSPETKSAEPTAEKKPGSIEKQDIEKLIPKEIKSDPGCSPQLRENYTQQLLKIKQEEKEIEEKIKSQFYLSKAFEQLGIDFHNQTEQNYPSSVRQQNAQPEPISQVHAQKLTPSEIPMQPPQTQPKQYKAIEIRILEDTNVRDFVASQTFLNPHKAVFEEDNIPMQYFEDKSHMQPFGRIVSEKRIVAPKPQIVEEPRSRWGFFKLLFQENADDPIFPIDENPLPKQPIIPRKTQMNFEEATPGTNQELLETTKHETPPITLPEHKPLIPQRNAIIAEHYSTAVKLAETMKESDLKLLDKERQKLDQIQADIKQQIADYKKKQEDEIAKTAESLLKHQADSTTNVKRAESRESEAKKESEAAQGGDMEGAQKETKIVSPESLLAQQADEVKYSETILGLLNRFKFTWLTGAHNLHPDKLFQYNEYGLGGFYDFYRTSYDENFQKNMKFWFLKYDSLVEFRKRAGVSFKEVKHTLRHQIIPELLDSIAARDYDKILHYVDDRVLLKWDNDNQWQVPSGITQHSKVLSVGAVRVREFLYDSPLPMAWMRLTFRVLRNRFWMQNGWIVRGFPERLIIDSYAIKLCVIFPEVDDPEIPVQYAQPRWIVTGLMPRGRRLWKDQTPRRRERKSRKSLTMKRFQKERKDALSQFTLNKSLRLFETEEGPVASDMNAWKRQYQLSPPIHYLYRRFTKAHKMGKIDDAFMNMLRPSLDEPTQQNQTKHTQRELYNLQQAQQKTPKSLAQSPTIQSTTKQNLAAPSVSANPILSDPLSYTIYEEKRVFEEVKKVKEEVTEYYKKVVDRIFEKRHYLADPFMDDEEAQAAIADIPAPPYLIKWTKQPLNVKKVAILLNRMHVIIHKQPFVNETFLTTMLSIHQQHRQRRREKREQNIYQGLHLKTDSNKIRNFNPEIMSKIRKVARQKALEDLQKEEETVVEKRKELAKAAPIPFSPESFQVQKVDPKAIKFEPYKPGSLFSVTKEGLLERQPDYYRMPRHGTSEAFVMRNKPKPNFQTEFWKRLENTRDKGPIPWWRPVVSRLETGDPMPPTEIEDEGYAYRIRDWKRIVDQAKRTRQKQQ